jgi:hypothetical protein
MKFKNKISKKATYTFAGQKRKCQDGFIHVEDEKEIEFLEKNPFFEKVDAKKSSNKDIKKNDIKEKKEIKEPEKMEK